MANHSHLADKVFKRSTHTDLSAHKNDLQLFNILLALDGKRSLRTIAKEDFYELDALTAKVEEMMIQGLIESTAGGGAVGGPTGHADQSFFNQLTAELTRMVGPVAGMLIKDTVEKTGHHTGNYPLGNIDELLSELATFIQDEAKSAEFKRQMRALAAKQH